MRELIAWSTCPGNAPPEAEGRGSMRRGRTSRQGERASGVLAGVLGLLGLGYALLGPTYSNGYGTASMLQSGVHPRAVPFLTAT